MKTLLTVLVLLFTLSLFAQEYVSQDSTSTDIKILFIKVSGSGAQGAVLPGETSVIAEHYLEIIGIPLVIDPFPANTLSFRYKDLDSDTEDGPPFVVENLVRTDSLKVTQEGLIVLKFKFDIPAEADTGFIAAYSHLSFNNGEIVIVPENYTNLFQVVSGVTSIEDGQIPLAFALKQNYPNPFNPTTEIHFDLPESSPVTLIIYDIMGREITRLVDHQRYEAGRHQVQWDAARFASGIYFYRIETAKHSVIRKMMLLK